METIRSDRLFLILKLKQREFRLVRAAREPPPHVLLKESASMMLLCSALGISWQQC